MDSETFQFNLSVPRADQFVSTVRELARQAARYANCGQADTDRFAGSVEDAVRACLQEATAGTNISIVVKRQGGPLEFLVDGHAVTVTP